VLNAIGHERTSTAHYSESTQAIHVAYVTDNLNQPSYSENLIANAAVSAGLHGEAR
jgi:hypothetical protein